MTKVIHDRRAVLLPTLVLHFVSIPPPTIARPSLLPPPSNEIMQPFSSLFKPIQTLDFNSTFDVYILGNAEPSAWLVLALLILTSTLLLVFRQIDRHSREIAKVSERGFIHLKGASKSCWIWRSFGTGVRVSFVCSLVFFLFYSPRSSILARNIGEAQVQENSLLDGVVYGAFAMLTVTFYRAVAVPQFRNHDRRFCIIEADTHKVITARDVAKMVLITPRILFDESSPHGGLLYVDFPEDSGCESFSVPLFPRGFEDEWKRINDIDVWGTTCDGFICESVSTKPSSQTPSAILSEYFDRPVHLAVKGTSPRKCVPTDAFPELEATAVYQDGYPLLVLSEESMDILQEAIRGRVAEDGNPNAVAGIGENWRTEELLIERPNIVLRGAGPFGEDNFEEISIGESSEGILLVSKCARCLLPNVSPDTGVRDKAVPYKVLMKVRTGIDPQNKMTPVVGCHGVPLGSGIVRVGDEVLVKKTLIPKWFSSSQQNQPVSVSANPAPQRTESSADTKQFGFENTLILPSKSYANSVLQALYFSAPFRDLLLQSPDASVLTGAGDAPPPPENVNVSPLVPVRRKPERQASTSGPASLPIPYDGAVIPLPAAVPIPTNPTSLFSALRSLFLHISTHPLDKGTVAPSAFIEQLRRANELFRSTMHQDAHEFFNYLLNKIVEEVEEERKAQQQGSGSAEDLSNSIITFASKATPTTNGDLTLVHKLFEGTLTSETRCLTCETVTSRDESFIDLSIDIEENSSVTACLRQFSASEMLCQRNKFFCDSCCELQEAEKRMKIKKLPNVLALHLKRFKYQEDVNKYIKLAYRVAFPLQLRLFNTVDEAEDADRLYNLFAIVVHLGTGPHHGHYISIIKSLGSQWLVFDDDNVYPITEKDIPKYYGDSNSGSAYVLYYEAADIDRASLGLQPSLSASASVSIPAAMVTSITNTGASVTSASAPPSPSQMHPTLPPGLGDEGELSDLNSESRSRPATPSRTSSILSSDKSKPVLEQLKIGLGTGGSGFSATSYVSGSGAVASPGLTVSGRKSLFSIRRPPSSKASPGGAGAVVSGASGAGAESGTVSSSPLVFNIVIIFTTATTAAATPVVTSTAIVSSGFDRAVAEITAEPYAVPSAISGSGFGQPPSFVLTPEKEKKEAKSSWFKTGKRKSLRVVDEKDREKKDREKEPSEGISSSPHDNTHHPRLDDTATTMTSSTTSSSTASSSTHWLRSAATTSTSLSASTDHSRKRRPSEPGPLGMSASSPNASARPKSSVGDMLSVHSSNGIASPGYGQETPPGLATSSGNPEPPAPQSQSQHQQPTQHHHSQPQLNGTPARKSSLIPDFSSLSPISPGRKKSLTNLTKLHRKSQHEKDDRHHDRGHIGSSKRPSRPSTAPGGTAATGSSLLGAGMAVEPVPPLPHVPPHSANAEVFSTLPTLDKGRVQGGEGEGGGGGADDDYEDEEGEEGGAGGLGGEEDGSNSSPARSLTPAGAGVAGGSSGGSHHSHHLQGFPPTAVVSGLHPSVVNSGAYSNGSSHYGGGVGTETGYGTGSGAGAGLNNLKRASRKLSISGNMFGFGRKKDKDKERERDVPSSFHHH
ncbi:hypothetical protein D9757_013329 [Collybiopsis confluens]|uniref:ubiquitinyl hydrolase 1 n=1 Tax=Collybiopsis confluens TaxID=2823264 RepID=A0A8H5G319_9AGAR|nr:hypothetical protein D9757_013329 [Collybiopsis confluens]